MINATKTYLPPLSEYSKYLEGIWERDWVTNHGPLATELESRLKEYLGALHLLVVNNGTVALQIAIKALGLNGEIITTPFSYVATTSSIVWEGCKPVFADIDPKTLTIDPKEVEAAITPRTQAIMPTHVYGNPCDVESISIIAKKHGLKVIYDAAHAFGVKYKGLPLTTYGDFSTLSLHATKLFHTVEGGALLTSNAELAHRASFMRNFGHNGQEDFWGLGINGKNSELHAAMGLCILPRVAAFIKRRKEITDLYDNLLLKTTHMRRPVIREGTEYNYAYYPIIFPMETSLLEAKAKLNELQIYPRRYFYPSLSKLNYVDNFDVPNAIDTSKRILCLPLYPELNNNEVETICDVVMKVLA